MMFFVQYDITDPNAYVAVHPNQAPAFSGYVISSNGGWYVDAPNECAAMEILAEKVLRELRVCAKTSQLRAEDNLTLLESIIKLLRII